MKIVSLASIMLPTAFAKETGSQNLLSIVNDGQKRIDNVIQLDATKKDLRHGVTPQPYFPCHAKDSCEWDCKRWCMCTEEFPWMMSLWSMDGGCPEDDDTCDCDPIIEIEEKDVPEEVEIVDPPRWPHKWFDPLWDPIPDMMVDVTDAIVCGDWVPPFNNGEYAQMFAQMKEYKPVNIHVQEMQRFLNLMGGVQTFDQMITNTHTFLTSKPAVQVHHSPRRLQESEQKFTKSTIQSVRDEKLDTLNQCKNGGGEYWTSLNENDRRSLLDHLDSFFLEDGYEHEIHTQVSGQVVNGPQVSGFLHEQQRPDRQDFDLKLVADKAAEATQNAVQKAAPIAQKAVESASAATQKAKEAAQNVAQQASQRAQNAVQKAAPIAQKAVESASAATQKAKEAAQNVAQQASQRAQEAAKKLSNFFG